jgi:hypothetical protein
MGPVKSLSVGAHITRFTFDGTSTNDPRFEFERPALSVRFARPGIDLSVLYGWNGGPSKDRTLIEASLAAWSGLLLTRQSPTRIYLPLAVHSGYRQVGADFGTSQATELFNFTTLGIGSGLVLERRFSNSFQIQARAMPIIGLALRGIEGYAGSSRLFDSDLQLNFLRLFGQYGISLSYGFRWQQWDIEAQRFLEIADPDLFDYSGTAHMFRIGLNW